MFHRAAGIAAVFFVAGLTSISTPSFAYELDKTDVITTLLPDSTSINVLRTDSVPAITITDPTTDTVEIADDVTPQEPAEDEEIAYPSLAAAVAAQDMPSDADAELTCLASAIYFESKGEPLKGQLAVAKVIINRAHSSRFPKSICSVVTQRGQFSFVRHGHIPAINQGRSTYRTAMAVAQVALDQAWDSPAGEALFFHARYVSPRWRLTKVASIGNHIFYR